MKVVLLSVSGSPKTIEVDDVHLQTLQKSTKYHGHGEFDEVFVYPKYNIVGFGWENGKESKINKTELPPPYDNTFFYGDIIVLRYNIAEATFSDFTRLDYQAFINAIHGGFDDCDESDNESYNTTEEDLDWKPGCQEFEDESVTYENSQEGTNTETETDTETLTDESEGSWDFEEQDTEDSSEENRDSLVDSQYSKNDTNESNSESKEDANHAEDQ